MKNIHFKLFSEEPQKLSLSVKGPKIITSNDIESNPQVEIINKDSYICEITGKTSFNLEFVVEKGIGYLSKEQVEKERSPIGTISLDAAFTPVKRVSYEVENMRVEDRTDHNRLKLAIETDGTISPKEVLENSITIMIKQLQAIVGFKETIDNSLRDTMSDDMITDIKVIEAESFNKIKITDLQFSTRTENALLSGGIKTLSGLLKKSENDLKELAGLGDKAIEEIVEVLEGKGLSLKVNKK